MFPFFQACQTTQTHFLVRAAQNRRAQEHEEEITYVLTCARSWSSQANRPFEIPARHGRQARWTQVQLAFGRMTLLPPRNSPRASKEPLTIWVMRVWEETAPSGEEPLEWILLTSVPTTTLEQGCRACGVVSVSVLGRGLSPMSQKRMSHRGTARASGGRLDTLVGFVVSSCRAIGAAYERWYVKLQSAQPARESSLGCWRSWRSGVIWSLLA